jgi:hypothetical protein
MSGKLSIHKCIYMYTVHACFTFLVIMLTFLLYTKQSKKISKPEFFFFFFISDFEKKKEMKERNFFITQEKTQRINFKNISDFYTQH